MLAKIYASDFSVGELIFLFTAGPHLDGDDPFPLQDENEALDSPLGLPDDDQEHALWRLRQRAARAVRVAEEEAEEWPWRRIEAALHAEFGFAAGDITGAGPALLPRRAGPVRPPVSPQATRFVSQPRRGEHVGADVEHPAGRAAALRSRPREQLSARVPLTDRAVIAKLTAGPRPERGRAAGRAGPVLPAPGHARPRFALLFADFAAAQRRLIEEADEGDRFGYFRRQFLLCRRRCHVIARHLSRHVAAATGQQRARGRRRRRR